jgi:hypothetical protein
VMPTQRTYSPKSAARPTSNCGWSNLTCMGNARRAAVTVSAAACPITAQLSGELESAGGLGE